MVSTPLTQSARSGRRRERWAASSDLALKGPVIRIAFAPAIIAVTCSKKSSSKSPSLPDRARLVLDAPAWTMWMDHDAIDVRQAEMEDPRLSMIDPDDRVIIGGHGVIPDCFWRRRQDGGIIPASVSRNENAGRTIAFLEHPWVASETTDKAAARNAGRRPRRELTERAAAPERL